LIPDSAELVALASRLAHEAGEVLRQRPDDLQVTTKSSPTDAVTVMDRAAERVILDGLAGARPGDTVISEESPRRAGSTGVTWFVDPLDGTVNYLYGLGHYAVSIGVAIDDEAVAGVVFDVERRVEYAAVRGDGATCDGRPIRCALQSDPAMALVATGFNYDRQLRTSQAQGIGRLLPDIRDIRRMGSAALDLCAVAAGRVDAFFEAGMAPWDWTAGAVIAREAGARVGGLRGRPPGGHTTLAANPELFDALEELLIAAGSDLG
jgi:myo-inositol-1(or 4)-monophosphatase